MSGCGKCGGSCESCGGCAAQLELTAGEVAMILRLGQYAFLPVGRYPDRTEPVCPDPELGTLEEASLILQCLEKKGLIDIDYSKPLKGCAEETYGGLPVKGSFALTFRGQQVLQLLEIQGADM